MNVLFLGNGFDLFHKLPTKYINFLNTVDYLSKQDVSKISTLGDVFGDENLRSRDREISENYDAYGELYNDTPVETEVLNQLKSLANNLWYEYFAKTLKFDVKWIDFEKEIFSVIQSFQNLFLQESGILVRTGVLDTGSNYIIENFDFFLDQSDNFIETSGFRLIKDEYLIEAPLGSRNKIINKTQIVKDLFAQLNELAEGLRLYLKFFVEKIVEKIPGIKVVQWEQAFRYTDYAITFNYTNTYELLYKEANVMHIHGNVNSRIVLGINPDVADMIETIDTTFVLFKKYFQRIKHKTDIKYLDFMEKNKDKYDFTLFVIGHSLDVTDKDIIQEMFSVARKIFILSYDEIDESNHISNLITIFGKSEFDRLRREKDVSFMSIMDDIGTFMRENSEMEELKRLAGLDSYSDAI